MNNLEAVYSDVRIVDYVYQRVESVSAVITDTCKLESRIYEKLEKYFEYKNRVNISLARVKQIVRQEIGEALARSRKERAKAFSDLAVTNSFGELLMFEPKDDSVLVDEIVEIREVYPKIKRKIARLASDDFEKYVLTAWSRGERSIDIAKDLAVQYNRDVAYFKLKVARFKKQCKKRWTKETFVS